MRFSDYMAAFNRYDDAALIRDFWTEDCVMQSGPRLMRGHKEMLEFLNWAHDGILETMRPKVVMEQGDLIFAEIDMDFTATRDLPDYTFGPLKTGESHTVKFFVQYTCRDGKVAHLKAMTWPPNLGVSRREARLGGTFEQRQAFNDYTRAFSSADFETFQQYYTEDVVCELGTLKLEGRQAIVDFYRGMFQKVRENLTLHRLVADETGLCADITSTFTAIEDASDFAPMPLAKGQVLTIPVFVIYTLRDGKISRIQVARGSGAPPRPA
jgi:ketosteroid isomerase-like protein